MGTLQGGLVMSEVITDYLVVTVPSGAISTFSLAEYFVDILGPVSYTHLTLPTSDLV